MNRIVDEKHSWIHELTEEEWNLLLEKFGEDEQ